MSLDLNSIPLSECGIILGKPNFNMMSENRWVSTVVVFLSFKGVVIR